MNYRTNRVQVSYFVELPQSNFPDYTNSLTFPDFSLTAGLFPDLGQIPRHFQVSRNSRDVVTLLIVCSEKWRDQQHGSTTENWYFRICYFIPRGAAENFRSI